MGLTKENKCCGTCAAWDGPRKKVGNGIVEVQDRLFKCKLRNDICEQHYNGGCSKWSKCFELMWW